MAWSQQLKRWRDQITPSSQFRRLADGGWLASPHAFITVVTMRNTPMTRKTGSTLEGDSAARPEEPSFHDG